jgi:hypothetical protein
VNPTEQSLAIIGAQRPMPATRAQGVSDVALSERYKAEVFARREQAVRFPRDVMVFRQRILTHCERFAFAEKARYSKPVGGGLIHGPSIRFVEAALQAYGNVDVGQQIIQDDASSRVVRVSVTDLETNVQVSEDVQVSKTIERRNPKQGDEILGERINSHGSKVYILAATDDDLQIKIAAAVSKKVRTCGLRLLPPDVVDEAIEQCIATSRSKIMDDPEGQAKTMADAFSSVGVSADQLGKYLGHSVLQCTPAEIDELRTIFAAIKDGETTWAAIAGLKDLPEGEASKAKSKLVEKLEERKGK